LQQRNGGIDRFISKGKWGRDLALKSYEAGCVREGMLKTKRPKPRAGLIFSGAGCAIFDWGLGGVLAVCW
jgi:hypothetical protein